MSTTTTTTGLSKSGGPLGLGDPNDRTLRKVELEVLIPKLIRERSKTDAEKCATEKAEFDRCCVESGGVTMVVKCRDENRRFQQCMSRWFRDQQFIAECREQYLAERAEFRRTGVKRRPARGGHGRTATPTAVAAENKSPTTSKSGANVET